MPISKSIWESTYTASYSQGVKPFKVLPNIHANSCARPDFKNDPKILNHLDTYRANNNPGKKCIKLYSSPISIGGMSVQYLLEYLKLEYEKIDLNLMEGEHKSPEYLKINPKGLVPTIVDDGTNVYETSSIMRYLMSMYGKPKDDHLYPKSPKERSLVEMALDSSITFFTAMFAFARHVFFMRQPKTEALEKALLNELTNMEKMLDNKPFFGGNKHSIADIAIYSIYKRVVMLELDFKQFPNLCNFEKRMDCLKSLKELNDFSAQMVMNMKN